MNVNAVSPIARSGMNAAQRRLDVAGHNIANGQTEPFRRQVVTQRELPQGGVATTVDQAETIGHDLPRDVVEQMSASYSYQANLHTLRTQQDMIGTLVDLRA